MNQIQSFEHRQGDNHSYCSVCIKSGGKCCFCERHEGCEFFPHTPDINTKTKETKSVEEIVKEFDEFFEENSTNEGSVTFLPNDKIKLFLRQVLLSYRQQIVEEIDKIFNYPCDCMRKNKECNHKWSDDFHTIRRLLERY